MRLKYARALIEGRMALFECGSCGACITTSVRADLLSLVAAHRKESPACKRAHPDDRWWFGDEDPPPGFLREKEGRPT